jgi:SulP family sulfate permease
MFGGIPATGAIARTATNVRNGARTPVAGIAHAATLLLVTLFFGRFAAEIPLAALGAILVIVAYHMSEWRTFIDELRSPKSDVAVLLTTFLLTVLVDLTVAISVGMVLAAFLFIRRVATTTNVTAITGGAEDDVTTDVIEPWRKRIPRGTIVFDVNGPFFFGAVSAFRETLEHLAEHPRVLIVRMREVGSLDSTALHALRDVVRRSRRNGAAVLFCDLQPQPRSALTDSSLFEEIGEGNLLDDIDGALDRAESLLAARAAS